jgi:hypothetical protein
MALAAPLSPFGRHLPFGGRRRIVPTAYGGSAGARRGGNLTGLADGKAGFLSFWLHLDGGDGSNQTIFEFQNRVTVLRDNANRLDAILRNAATTVIGRRETLDTYTAGTGFVHFALSWDLAAGAFDVYVDDAVPTLNTGVSVTTDDTIEYTADEVSVGVRASSDTLFLNGCLHSLVFHDSYLDLSSEANRRKLIRADGRPADLGGRAAGVFSEVPRLFAPDGNPVLNRGTGGGFSAVGAPGVCAETP